MKTSPIILDHVRKIELDPANPPFNNYQAFKSNYVGLKILADSVREFERQYIAKDPYASHVVLHLSFQVPDLIPCAFNWFSVTLVNYLRLIALVELMVMNHWKSSELVNPINRQNIRNHCTDYVRAAVPEVYLWRNKVSAHFAATDPFHDDNLGTLEQSLMNSITYKYPYYHVGLFKWNTDGEQSQLSTWSLTKVYEDLCTRYWPDMHLQPVIENVA